ncbi:MAG TPA: cupin domain-containing protein [Casimicrobiaceae bacterium]|nr:cupin domain-containing protein [Casimicrobiaceae bacterium]
MEVKAVDAVPAQNPPEQFFTGKVHLRPLFGVSEPSRMSCGCVTFHPSARSAWHAHPLGQTLIVTSGRGFVQSWGGPIREIKAGDVIWTPPGEKHWHGAAPDSSMTHIAIQETLNGKNVDWMEKVTDEEYRKAK